MFECFNESKHARVIQGVHVFTLNQSFYYIDVGGKILHIITLIIKLISIQM